MMRTTYHGVVMSYVALIIKTLAFSMIVLFFSACIISIHSFITVNGIVKVQQKHGFLLISGFEQHMKQGHVHVSYHRY